jgi:membrane protease YdiL (CAAX protease family)
MTDNLNFTLTGKQKAIIMTGIALVIIIPVVLSLLLLSTRLDLSDRIFYSRFIYWLEVLIMFFYAHKAEHRKFLLWDEKEVEIGFFIVAVVVLYFIALACGLVSNIPSLFGWREDNAVMKRLLPLFVHRQWLLILTVFTAGVTEELLMRGYVLTRVSLLVKNRYVPVIVSALLFSALHFSYKSLKELIFAFLIGVIYGIFYQKYRNIKVLIAAHFLLDLVNLELAIHFYKLIK